MKPAAKYACNYAVLRFLPYPETGEFINLGVAAHCPATGFFGMALEGRKTKRVTDFFPELDPDAFRTARRAITAELERVGRVIARERELELRRRIFRELVRPREAVFRFGEVRTILTDDPTTLASRLFADYVNRQFAEPKEYQETVMARQYFEALRQFKPGKVFYRERLVGTDEYHVRVPIITGELGGNAAPRRAIKPLDLQRPDSTAVTEHGDLWIQRVRRLHAVGRMPERFVFAVRHNGSGPEAEAARSIIADLEAEGAVVIGAEETERLLELAAD